MIIQIPTKGFEETLIHTYSTLGVKIRQVETGAIYNETDDVIPCPYHYEETNELIDK